METDVGVNSSGGGYTRPQRSYTAPNDGKLLTHISLNSQFKITIINTITCQLSIFRYIVINILKNRLF